MRQRLAALPVYPLAGGDRPHFVRIVPLSITGSRLHRPTRHRCSALRQDLTPGEPGP
jgi:hypothetical protein